MMQNYSFDHRVTYSETDRMGRVYHSNFLLWMEEARTEFIRKSGISYKELEGMGILLPISEIKVKYIKPVEYDEIVTTQIWIEEYSRIKVKFGYKFWNHSKTICFGEAESVNIFTGTDGKIKKMDEELLGKIMQKR